MADSLGACLVPALLLAGAGGPAFAAEPLPGEPRAQISLDGEWEFRADPNGAGAAERWFAAATPFPDRISVPGNWQAQGIGEPAGVARHNYQGKAWFRRTVSVPEGWGGTRIWLRFEGVCNWGDVYVGDTLVGRVDALVAPYEFDITDQLPPGREFLLTVMADSKPPTGVAYTGMMQFLVAVGGITSHVSLEARPDLHLERVMVRTAPALRGFSVSTGVGRGAAAVAWDGACQVRVLEDDGSVAARAQAPILLAAGPAVSDMVTVRVPFPQLEPWSPERPRLYHLEATLQDAAGCHDRYILRTGFRHLVVDPATGSFRLNGQALFLRGCGYDSLEPVFGSPPPDRGVYTDRLRHLKAYGFNAIRFLAHHPLREFFEAADEVGMLVQSEGEWFLAGAPMTPATGALLAAQVPRLIAEFGHHPSWYSFSCFNEAFNAHIDPVKQAYIQSAFRDFRALKPDHLFVASDGGGDQWPTDIITDRSAMDRAYGIDPATAAPQQVFGGQVQTVAVFRRALDEESVRQLAAERPSPSAAGCALAERLGASRCWPGPFAAPGQSLASEAEQALPARGSPFSVSAWICAEGFAVDDWGTFFSCGLAETGRALILALDGKAGDGRLSVGRYWDNILQSKRALTAGRWHHVAMAYDGARLCLWLDGTLDSTLDAALDIPPRDLAIGRLVSATLRAAADYASRPHVWHEFDNTYIAPLPDLEIEARLTGAQTQAWVLEPHRRRLAAYGLLPRYADLRQLSIRRYREYVKQAFERARALPNLDGYSWWVVSDIPGGVETDVTSYGVLDMLYQPEKFPDPAWFRQFNHESVLLLDTDTDRRTLGAGQRLTVTVSLSHFGSHPVRQGEVTWSVNAGQRTLSRGRLAVPEASPGRLTPLGSFDLGPFETAVPLSLSLSVELRSEACNQNNQWSLWVFPARKQDLPAGRVANRTGEAALDRRYGSAGDLPLEGAALVLATRVTGELLDWVEAGGTAILLERNPEAAATTRPGVGGGSPAVPSALLRQPGSLTYWPLWLRCDAQIVESHAALGDFPHDGFSGFQLMRLFGSGVPTIDFTPADALARRHVLPIVWGLSLIPRQEEPSPFGYVLSYGSALGEARLGRGRLLICGLWVLDGVCRDFPEAGYLLDCLVAYGLTVEPARGPLPLTREAAQQLFAVAE